jgi:predicted ATP-dependent endonuclease of OLD family
MPILARKLGSDFDNFGVSVIAIGDNNFGRFVELLTGFRIPCIVMCDKDTLTNIYRTIKIDGQEIKTSILIKQLDDFNRLSPDDKNIIKENSSNEIQQTKQSVYSDKAFNILNQSIAYKNNYIVLSSDFEGVFKKAGHTHVFEEANEEYGDNKVLQGRFVAYKINKDYTC